MKSKEELLEGSWHLDLIVVLEGLVQLVEDHHQSIFRLGRLLCYAFDLLPSDATKEVIRLIVASFCVLFRSLLRL